MLYSLRRSIVFSQPRCSDMSAKALKESPTSNSVLDELGRLLPNVDNPHDNYLKPLLDFIVRGLVPEASASEQHVVGKAQLVSVPLAAVFRGAALPTTIMSTFFSVYILYMICFECILGCSRSGAEDLSFDPTISQVPCLCCKLCRRAPRPYFKHDCCRLAMSARAEACRLLHKGQRANVLPAISSTVKRKRQCAKLLILSSNRSRRGLPPHRHLMIRVGCQAGWLSTLQVPHSTRQVNRRQARIPRASPLRLPTFGILQKRRLPWMKAFQAWLTALALSPSPSLLAWAKSGPCAHCPCV